MTDTTTLTGTITCTPPLTAEQWAKAVDASILGLGAPLDDTTPHEHARFTAVLADDGQITAVAPLPAVAQTLEYWASDLYMFLGDLKQFAYPMSAAKSDRLLFGGQLHGRDGAGPRYVLIVRGMMVEQAVIADPVRLGQALVRAARAYLQATVAEEGEEICGYHKDYLAETFAPLTRLGWHQVRLADEYLYFIRQCYRVTGLELPLDYGHLDDALDAQHYTYATPVQAIAAIARTTAAMLGITDTYHRALRDLAATTGAHHIDPRAPRRQEQLIAAPAIY